MVFESMISESMNFESMIFDSMLFKSMSFESVKIYQTLVDMAKMKFFWLCHYKGIFCG